MHCHAGVMRSNMAILASPAGIIIDTFAELREQREHLLRHLSTKCLMCGIDASDFDQLASGFDHHVRFDHHIWHYIYFMHYLQLKPFYELSGLEQYCLLLAYNVLNAPQLGCVCYG